MPTTAQRTRVEAIPGTPSPYGLLSAATVLDSTDPHELLGIEWEPLSCATALTTDYCNDDPEFDPTKVFDRGGVDTAGPVTVYYGQDCPPMGRTFDEAATRVRSGLAIGEPAALEGWFETNVLSPAATDLTPAAGPMSPPQALAVLEGYLGVNYGGVGVVHVPIGLAAVFGAAGILLDKGARRETWAGNLVALGAGYEVNVGPVSSSGDPTDAAADAFWVYITGPVTARREAVDVLARGDRDALDIVLNDRYMLAERTWVLSYECAVAAIQVARVVGTGGGGSGDTDIDGGTP